MPELPEVEAVRAGLARHLSGRTISAVDVLDARPLRRHAAGPEDFAAALAGRTVLGAARRGKLMWLPLDDGRALVAHLGMSGQLLVRGSGRGRGIDPAPFLGSEGGASGDEGDTGEAPVDLTATRAPSLVRDLSTSPRHLRVRIRLAREDGDAPGGAAVDLVDQRMLGGLRVEPLVPTADGAPGGHGMPEAVLPAGATALARDLLDPALDRAGSVAAIRRLRRAAKALLMDQGVVSGVGNIYADEGLWAARVHGRRPGSALGPRVAARLLVETAAVMERALVVGGTSFDALYVDADGAPGYFARSLAAYGREGRPCRRCGTPLLREVIGGRSHTFCPACQTRPRAHRARP